jgi:hypothetical protein
VDKPINVMVATRHFAPPPAPKAAFRRRHCSLPGQFASGPRIRALIEIKFLRSGALKAGDGGGGA